MDPSNAQRPAKEETDSVHYFEPLSLPREQTKGAAYLGRLKYEVFQHGEDFYEKWLNEFARLFRIYKQAGREFLRFLWEAAYQVMAVKDLWLLAWPTNGYWEGDVWEVELGWPSPEQAPIAMVDAILLDDSPRRIVSPEMLLAGKTELLARQMVDKWHEENPPPDIEEYERAEKKKEAHRRWTEILIDNYEMLLLECEGRYGSLAASLNAIEAELLEIRNGSSVLGN